MKEIYNIVDASEKIEVVSYEYFCPSCDCSVLLAKDDAEFVINDKENYIEINCSDCGFDFKIGHPKAV